MPLGITLPFGAPLAQHRPVVERLVGAGYTDLWTAETARTDAFTPLVAAATWSPEARLGTAIASVFGRGPGALAMAIAGLCELAPGRVAVGLGSSSAAMVEGWNDRAFDRPASRTIDTVRFLRRALAGEKVSDAFDTFSVKGFTLERPPSEPPPLLLAALRPRLLEAAGADADGVILNWLSAGDVRTVTPIVHDAAGGAPREVVARIFVCPSTDTDAVRAAARRLIAGYLTVPVYADYQRWLGRGDALGELWERWSAGDRKEAAASVPDAVVDDLIGHGDADACAAFVAGYAEAGVTTPVVKVLELVDGLDAVEAAASIAEAMARRAA